jgi:predicted ATPase
MRGLIDRSALSQFADDKRSPKEVREYAELTLDALSSIRFLDLSPEAMRLPSIPGQVVLGDRGENLSSVLQAICEDPARKRAIAGWLRQLTPLDVVDFDLEQDSAGRVLLALVEADGRRVSANSASDGTLRFLAMIAAFLGSDPARFYFLEELETGLHPTRLSLLLELIETQTSRGVSQVVATTHSSQLLALLSQTSKEAAVLAYRLRGHQDQRLTRVVDLPDARRILKSQDLMRLHATGWLEDATEFAEPESERSTTGVSG